MEFEQYERRRGSRYEYRESVVYFNRSNGRRHYAGFAVDISNGGMGLLTFEPISRGQELTFESKLPGSHKKAVVLWIKKYIGTLSKAGLFFIDS